MKIYIEDRKNIGKPSFGGWKPTQLPEIFGDELNENDFIMVSHAEDDGINRNWYSMKIKLSELMKYIMTYRDPNSKIVEDIEVDDNSDKD